MSSKTSSRLLLLLLGLTLASVRDAAADATPIPHGTVELLADTASIQPGRGFNAGLNFHLEPGWHIYWINPGDAGQPPRVTWRLPAGITAQPIQWPVPEALPAFSYMDFGYQNQVLLLVPMTAGEGVQAAPADIAAEVKLIVCRDVCIPGKAQVSLTLPVTNRAAAANLQVRQLFDAARKQLPRPVPAGWKFNASSGKDSFQVIGIVGHPIAQASFFPLEPSQIESAAPQTVRTTKTGFAMSLKKSQQLLKPIRDLKGILVLGGNAYTISVPVQ